MIPEYVARHWWERILYNQSARRLRSILLGRPHTVVVDVPYRRDDKPDDAPHDAADHDGPGPEPPGAHDATRRGDHKGGRPPAA